MHSQQKQKSLSLSDLMNCDLKDLAKLSDRYVIQMGEEKEVKNSNNIENTTSSSSSHFDEFIPLRVSAYTQIAIIALRISELMLKEEQQPRVNISRMESNKKEQFKAIHSEFTPLFNHDKDQLIELAEWVGRSVTSAARSKIYSGQDPHRAHFAAIFSFWHAIQDMEEKIVKHAATIEKMVNLAPQSERAEFKKQFGLLLKRFDDLPALRKAYEKIQPIGLYIYRFNQFMAQKNRKLEMKDGWLQPNYDSATLIRDYTKGCEDYCNTFKEVYFSQHLNKSGVFEKICDLNQLLELQEFPTFLTSIQQELSQEMLNSILSWTATAVRKMYNPSAIINAEMLNVQMPNTGTLIDFANLVGNEQTLKDLMQFSHQFIIRLRNKNILQVVTEVTPEEFNAHYKESQHQQLSFEEVKLIERHKKKEAEKAEREEMKVERQALATLSITQELKEKNLAAQAQKIETRKQELLERYKSMSSHQQKTLRSLLNPELSVDKYKETIVINTLVNMGLYEKTEQGYKVSFVGTTHLDNSDGKVDAHFIVNLREHFSAHGITYETLNELVQAESTNSNQGPST